MRDRAQGKAAQGEGQTSMTATPAHTPRRMPKFSCSHACAFSMHPCGKTHVSLCVRMAAVGLPRTVS